MSIVTFLTDFGSVDGYVGAMKGVVLCRAPRASLVDISHQIAPQDVRAGAWALRQAAPFFPAGTIHVAVVDPGVGSERRPLVVESAGQIYVGPDNGLLSAAYDGAWRAWQLTREELFLRPTSATFHGRDIFASVAAHLAAGRAPEACGELIDDPVSLGFERVVAERDAAEVCGRVIHIDRFGNLITNIVLGAEEVGRWRCQLGAREIGVVARTFADVHRGAWVAYLGSSMLLEIGKRDGDGARELSSGLDSEVRLWPLK